MTATPEETRKPAGTEARPASTQTSHPKIDRNAPAGSKNSLGEESVRDGRPATKDDIVEAKDEMPPGSPN